VEQDPLTRLARARAALARRAFAAVTSSERACALLARSRAQPVRGQVLDPAIAAMLGLDDLGRASVLAGLAPVRARARVAEEVLVVNPPPSPGVATRDVSFEGPVGMLGARLYEPAGLSRPSPGVVFIHGGGFVTGSVDSHDGACRRLAERARARVLSLDYRRAPEHPFPAAVTDCRAGLRHALSRGETLGLDPARIAVMGDSAGGNLCAVLARQLKSDARRPALAVLVYPATDVTCGAPSHTELGARYFLTSESIAWYYDHYVPPGFDRRDPDLSPLFAEDLAGCPRTLIFAASFDPLVDEARSYGERLRSAGVSVDYHELPRLIHGFLLMEAVPAARRAAERVAKQVGAELGASV
jgi:acetyl esterase/lipase